MNRTSGNGEFHFVMLIWTIFIAVLACLVGGMAALNGFIVLAGVIALVLLGLVVVYPHLALYLIPISALFSPVLPRVGKLGALEYFLILSGIAVFIRSLVLKKKLKFDGLLAIMIVLLSVFVLSLLAGRGDQEFSRVYAWLGTVGYYFVIINAVSDSHYIGRILLVLALLTTGLLLLDSFIFSGVPLPKTEYDWARYRSLGTSLAASSDQLAGQANFAMSMATIFFPVFFVFGVFSKQIRIRVLCFAGLAGMLLLALMVQTRAFFLQAGIAIVATMIPILKRRTIWRLVVVLMGSAFVLYFAIEQLFPGAWVRIANRFTEVPLLGDSRFDIWVGMIRVGMTSPLIGHGAYAADTALQRFGILTRHGLFPQIFFEYGLIGLVPTLGILGWWIISSIRTLHEVVSAREDPRVALALWGIVVGLFANSIINLHLIFTPNYSVLAFSVAALQQIYLRDSLHAHLPHRVENHSL